MASRLAKRGRAVVGVPCVQISPGVTMPCVGFGVGTRKGQACAGPACFEGIDGGNPTVEAVYAALESGIRHIDEAEVYRNEAFTGEALKAWLANTGTPRTALFITGKVLPSVDGSDGWSATVEASCRKSIQRLGVEYFDLYLIHAPFPLHAESFKRSLSKVWQDMELLVDLGLTRSIGVSNFRISDLEQVQRSARISPCLNQIEMHPHLRQQALTRYCASKGIAVAAYGALAPLTAAALRKSRLATEVLPNMAHFYGKTPAQILQRWNYQCLPTGHKVLITTTSQPFRVKEYLGTFDRSWELSTDDIHAIDEAGAEETHRGFWDSRLDEEDDV